MASLYKKVFATRPQVRKNDKETIEEDWARFRDENGGEKRMPLARISRLPRRCSTNRSARLNVASLGWRIRLTPITNGHSWSMWMISEST